MSPLTIWHYLLIASVVLLLILAVVIAMLQKKYRFSIFITIASIIALVAFFTWRAINESVYIVTVSKLSQQRYLQSEQILIKGWVTNSGKYPVANVVATIKLSNINTPNSKNALFSQPSVFKEIYRGDNPDFKAQNIIETHAIADYIEPLRSKPFQIMMKYPSHFKNASFEVEAKASY